MRKKYNCGRVTAVWKYLEVALFVLGIETSALPSFGDGTKCLRIKNEKLMKARKKYKDTDAFVTVDGFYLVKHPN
jgi:hypothetical protein